MNLALGQQAWGPTLTRLRAVLPQQDWQPTPPAGLEDLQRLLDGFDQILLLNSHAVNQVPGLRSWH